MTKIAIVTSEGGMRCAYSVGVLLALVDKYKLTDPDIVIGSSGSTGGLSYFVSKQYKEIQNIWENLLSTPKFVSLGRPWKIMDIDYMIDEVFKKQEPLDIEAIKRSQTKLFIAATNIKKGKVQYFTNNDDIFEALRASSAIPFFYGKKVKISEDRFVDGAISANLSKNIDKARELDASKIIAVNNANEGFVSELFSKVYNFFHPNLSINNVSGGFQLNNDVFVIKPSRKLPITNVLDNDQEHLKQAIKIGYDDVMNNTELVGFLKD